MGKPMLSELDLATAGVNTKGLHKHYMAHANDDNTSIVGQFKAENLHSGPGFFSISWSDLYDVFNLDALDISLIHCLTLQLARESKNRQLGVEFIDPQDFSAQVINSDPQHVESAITKVLGSSPDCVLAAHHTDSHYFLVVICPKWEIVWYMDSLRPCGDNGITLGQRDFTSIKAVIDRGQVLR